MPSKTAFATFLDDIAANTPGMTWWHLGSLRAVADEVTLTLPTALDYFADHVFSHKSLSTRQQQHNKEYNAESENPYLDVVVVKGHFETMRNHDFGLDNLLQFTSTLFDSFADTEDLKLFLGLNNLCFMVMRRLYTTTRKYVWEPVSYLACTNPLERSVLYIAYCGTSNGMEGTVDITKDAINPAFTFLNNKEVVKPDPLLVGC